MRPSTTFLLSRAMAAALAVMPFFASAGPVFPGAVGFGRDTPAGSGGRVIKVTNLNASGTGSLAAALGAKGPRIVVFEVGGVIDLAGDTLKIAEPFLTVAGQSAPNPGISLIRGGIYISTHDVLIQHLRVRAGDRGLAKKSGWEVDSMSTNGAWNVVVDHCSLAWGTDENLSASGERFHGQDADEWRQGTSHDVTFSHCIIAEGLYESTHKKGGHSKGSLIHDNTSRIAVVGNLYASNIDRNPLFKGGARGVVVNNLIDNPGSKAMHYRLVESEWGKHAPVAGQMAIVGNVLQHGPDTHPDVPLLSYDGGGPLEVFLKDNLAQDRSGKPVEITQRRKGAKEQDLKLLEAPAVWPDGLVAAAADQVRETVLHNAGARPWDRDEVDQRIVRQVREGKGKILDSQEQVGGYPRMEAAARALEVPKDNIESWLQGFCKPAQER